MVNGWVNLYKHRGISSNKILSKIKKLFKTKVAGHIGTLDPEAEGVLPIALGEATKTIAYINDESKGYEFIAKFGIETDTGDLEGKIINSCSIIPTKRQIKEILPLFLGDVEQVPPMYSAIKIDGKRAYQLARKGESFTIKSRKVEITQLELLDFKEDLATFLVFCSKGTYVRTLAADIAKKLGSLACAVHIKRVKSGTFLIKNAIMLDKLEEIVHNAKVTSELQAVEFVLDDIPVVEIHTEQIQKQIKNGQKINLLETNPGLYKLLYQGKILAIGELKDGLFAPKRVFNL